MYAVDTLELSFLGELLYQLFGYSVHAAHSGHYPYLVSYAHLAIGSLIAHKGSFLLRNVELLVYRLIAVLQSACKVGFQVVFVNPCAGLHGFLGMANGVAILDDVLALGHVFQEHFVARRNVLQHLYGLAVGFYCLTFFKRSEANYYGVGRIDFDE